MPSSSPHNKKSSTFKARNYNWWQQKWAMANAFIKNVDKQNLNITFLKAFIANPSLTGSVVPSSQSLANEMASHVKLMDNQIVVELGAGTGSITQALLAAGILPAQLIVIEYAPAMVKKLRQRFPQVRIIEGDAAQLESLLMEEKDSVMTIISSLPLRSLPKSLTHTILEQIGQLLPQGGQFIQYTYSFSQNRFPALGNYKLNRSKRIWRNLPPARVDVMTKYSD